MANSLASVLFLVRLAKIQDFSSVSLLFSSPFKRLPRLQKPGRFQILCDKGFYTKRDPFSFQYIINCNQHILVSQLFLFLFSKRLPMIMSRTSSNFSFPRFFIFLQGDKLGSKSLPKCLLVGNLKFRQRLISNKSYHK